MTDQILGCSRVIGVGAQSDQSPQRLTEEWGCRVVKTNSVRTGMGLAFEMEVVEGREGAGGGMGGSRFRRIA